MKSKKIKVLHTVEQYFPVLCGMQEVVQRISEHLSKNNFEVHIATSFSESRKFTELNGVTVHQFKISGNLVNGYQFGETEKYRQFLLNSDFDIITNFAAQQWATDLMLPILDQIKAKKIFVPTGFSGLYNPAYQNYFIDMRTWLTKFDHIVFLSNDYRDILFTRELGLNNFSVIPNGAASEDFLDLSSSNDIRSKLQIPKDHKVILLVGSHTGVKGHKEAIDIFVRSKIKNATLLIVGNVHSPKCYSNCKKKEIIFKLLPFVRLGHGLRTLILDLFQGIFTLSFVSSYFRNKSLKVVDLERKDIISIFKSSDLFFFPSNIECSPIVLFEAMAAGLPFFCTDVGNAREIIEWSQGAGQIMPTLAKGDGLVAADVEKSAVILGELLHDHEKLKLMSASGRKCWVENHKWDKISDDYGKMYRGLIEI